MNNFLAFILAIFLLMLNAFFVAGEFAVISVRREQIISMTDKWGYSKVVYALDHASVMLACTQLGITLASTALGVIAEPAIAHFLEAPFVYLGLSAYYAHFIAFILALLIVVFLHVIFGEIIPKNISVSMPEKAIFILAPPLIFIAKVLGPIVIVLDNFSNKFIKLFDIEPKTEVSGTYNIEEFASLVEESKAQGTLKDEGNLISGVIEFSSLSARQVMVPLEDVYTLDLPVRAVDVERATKETGFSRFVLLDSDGNFDSYIHVKDILFVGEDNRFDSLSKWRLRLLDVVNADDEIEDVLHIMQKSGLHIAKVVDGDVTIGVVFLEDIIEELVGEIKDMMQKEEELNINN